MDPGGDLVFQGLVDGPVHLNAALAGKGGRDDSDTKMGLAAFAPAAMPLVAVDSSTTSRNDGVKALFRIKVILSLTIANVFRSLLDNNLPRADRASIIPR